MSNMKEIVPKSPLFTAAPPMIAAEAKRNHPAGLPMVALAFWLRSHQ